MKNLTMKPMGRALLMLAIPIILGNLLQTIYQFTDLFWIGRYGIEGVAAVSLAGPVIFFFVSLGIGFSVAGTILVSQYKGNKNNKALNQVVGQNIVLISLFSLLISLIGYFASSWVIGLMGVSQIVTLQAILYLKISFVGIFFVFGFMSIQGLLRGIGEVKKPMYIILGTVVLNFIVDPIFILGYKQIPAYGIQGAAMATICTQSLAFIIALIVIYRKGRYGIYLKRKYFVLKKALVKKIFYLGVPSSIEMSARSLGMVVLSYIVASFGTTIIAAYGVGNQIFSVVIFIAVGFSMATTTLVGQYIGAGDINKAEKTTKKALSLSFLPLTLIGVVIFFLAQPLMVIFVPNDLSVITTGTLFLKIMVICFGFFGVQQVFSGVFRGAGETKLPMILTILSLWGIQIPVAYFGSLYRGEMAIWVSVPVSVILVAVVTGVWYLKGGRKNKKITHKDDNYI